MVLDILEKENDSSAVSRLKEIYSFNVERTESVKVTETETRKNDEGVEEEVEVTKEVDQAVPYRIIIKQPNRREMEEAELEYSVEMSKCIKSGILTKAMLAKKYSDSGGLMAEEDAQALTRLYLKFGELSNDVTRLMAKKKPNSQEKDKLDVLRGKLGQVRKEIIDMESSYASLFNHTADSRAQSKAVMWYLLHLAYIRKDNEDETQQIFQGETFQDKICLLYTSPSPRD